MKEIRNDFPVLHKHLYFNTASCGLLSKPLVAWRQQQDAYLLEGGSVFRDTHKPHIERVRDTVARFNAAQSSEVALVPNFSFGLNTLVDGVSNGQKVLLLEKDYPSINWVFEHRDFDVCYAKIDKNLEENIERAILENQPDILAFSVVQYLNGIKIDFNFLKKLKAYHPNLLIIGDGTQFLGTEVFNFSESAFDVLGCSTYKWMLSGYGNGYFMIKQDAQSSIFPNTIGFNSADAIFSRQDDLPFVKRFEPGHQDTLNYGSLEQSILYMESIGRSKIETQLALLSKTAKAEFEALDLLEEAVKRREEHSTIFNLSGIPDLFQKLTKNNIICSQRGDGVRVSFHFYNSIEEVDTLVSLLKSFIR